MQSQEVAKEVTSRLEIAETIAQASPAQWNRLDGARQPFLRYEFLHALEAEGCLGEHYGWLPRHLLLYDAQERLVGACPLYLKFNSYGEFVFDWNWADAYQRSGRAYYPKLVSASPYTPATGPKLLLHPEADARVVREQLMLAGLELAKQQGLSSLHWLFTSAEETRQMEQANLLLRRGCQFHWHNAGYRDFDDYLSRMRRNRRKAILRERRQVQQAGIAIECLSGSEVSEQQWATFHRLYASTFDRKGGMATLSLDFFQRIAREMPESVLLVLAFHQDRIIAAAFNLVGPDCLYGRHWGCFEQHPGLHFELCYYQGLAYCIDNGLARFEPGAQGEHKVWRGFLPSATWSAHWIADPQMHDAIAHFLALEREGMQDYEQELLQHSPFKESPEPR